MSHALLPNHKASDPFFAALKSGTAKTRTIRCSSFFSLTMMRGSFLCVCLFVFVSSIPVSMHYRVATMTKSSSLALEEDCPREMAAATLLGVRERVLASSPPSSSMRNPNRWWLDSEAVVPSESSASHDVRTRAAATPFTATATAAATPASYIQHQHNNTPADSVAITTFPPTAVSSSSRNKEEGEASTMHQSHHQHQSHPQFLSMSSLGLGVDTCVQEDATLACQRALQDAMNRNLLRLSGSSGNGRQQQELVVLLGVPRGLHVHQGQIQGDLPRDTKATICIQEGGLWIQSDHHSPAICSVVACLTLQQQQQESSLEEHAQEEETHSQRNGSTTTTTKPHETNGQSREPSLIANHHHHQHPTSEEDEDGNDSTLEQYYDPVSSPEHRAQAHPTETSTLSATATSSHKLSTALSRTHSMEVLAMISERLANDAAAADASSASKAAPAIRGGLATAALEESRSTNLVAVATEIRPLIVPRGAPAPTSSASITSDEDAAARQQQLQAYNYQKLPPGLTMKNNRRLFVQHAYQDFCHETPLAEELNLLKANNTKTPNAAFPLKLHEILTEIEHNGQAHIIGWLPHGRSFRIHKPQEFCDFILPRYFVMTKKSSFLRQLNLYGFNRFSAGPDQGSYYHEKFLRGMKFLTRRMTRQKVNGNRIRSAGNPEEEPHLANYPACPPPAY